MTSTDIQAKLSMKYPTDNLANVSHEMVRFCLLQYYATFQEDQQKLQLLVDTAVNFELPVSAWVCSSTDITIL